MTIFYMKLETLPYVMLNAFEHNSLARIALPGKPVSIDRSCPLSLAQKFVLRCVNVVFRGFHFDFTSLSVCFHTF